jgi:acetyl-CoA C-acetyltransferase
MSSRGITDKIAIVGMGCTTFGERWDKGVDDLLVDAATEASASAGMPIEDIDAFWLGTFGSGVSGVTLSKPLKIAYKPVSRNENFCATGSEAFRNACYAVASGAYDSAMAIGVEKVKDAGLSGLPFAMPGGDGTMLDATPVGTFSHLAVGYAQRYGLDDAELKDAMTHVAWKNHRNGALNPRAQFRREIPKDTIACAPPLAGNVSLMDCGGIADGSAAAIIVRAEDAHRYTDKPVFVKALAFAVGPGTGQMDPGYDHSTFPEVVASAEDAYRQAGVTEPRAEISFAEVHDCFTITEILLAEDLGFVERGTAWKEMLAGTFDLDGDLPINPDGGLKSFGHPLGASGIRMLFECWLQLRGEAGERQLGNGRPYALTQNLGGNPGECVSFVSLLGAERSA